MSEWVWRIMNIVVWVAVALAFYFSNNMTTGDSIAKVSERISIAEVKVQQETAGYRVLQEELARRMERMEVKIDNLSLRIDNAQRHGGTR